MATKPTYEDLERRVQELENRFKHEAQTSATTGRQSMEEALRESERKYRELVETANSAIIRWQSDGTITFFNEYARAFFGYTAEEIVGKHVKIIIPEAERTGKDLTSLVNDIVNHPERYVNNVNENICRGGRRVWMTWTNKAILDENGGVREILAIGTDVTELKEAEAALQRSENEKRLILDSTDEILAFHDTDHNLIWANKAYLDSTGLPLSELKGKKCFTCWGLGKLCSNCPVTKAIKTGKTQSDELSPENQPHWPDGQGAWHVRAAPVRASDGKIIGAIEVAQEITERKRAEEALRRSEERWNAAIENFGEGAIIATEDEQVIYWNPAAREMHGFTRPDEGIEPLEKTRVTFQLWTPDGNHLLELDEWPMRRIKNGETIRNLELRLRRPDQGWEKIVSYSGAMVETTGGERLIFLSAYNLTERRKAETAAAAAHRQVQSLINNTPAIVYAFDLEERFLLANTSLAELLNATPEQMIGKRRHEFMPKADADWHEANDREVFASGQALEFEEHSRLPGRSIAWLTTKFPLRDAQGKIYAVAGISTDVSARKQAEEALQKAHDELEEKVAERTAQLEWKNRELQEFASVASHDLQEPLRKIQAFGDMLQHEASEHLTDTGQNYLSRMRDAASRMQKLIKDLLAYSRVSTKVHPFECVDLKWLAERVSDDMHIPQEPKKPVIEISDLPTIDADPIQITQLLQNLLGNAIRYSKNRERPIIKIHGAKVQPLHGSKKAFLELRIEDNGIGFDMKYHDKIFQPFERLHGRGEYEGTGMGLAICRKIVERHGGKIIAESELGKGSTFIVRLPMRQA